MFAATPPDAPIAITSVQVEPAPAAVPAVVPPSEGALVPRAERQRYDDDDDRDDMRIRSPG